MAPEIWKEWEEACLHYTRATGLNEKEDMVRVSILPTVIGPQARRAFATFQWEEAADKEKISANKVWGILQTKTKCAF